MQSRAPAPASASAPAPGIPGIPALQTAVQNSATSQGVKCETVVRESTSFTAKLRRVKTLGGNVAEQLHQYARVHEIVPVESWRKDGVEGWLFRDKENQTIFVETAELMRDVSTVECV